MAVLFDRDDESYQRWLHANPSGYVLNVRRNLSPSYMVLHLAGCHSVKNYGGTTKPGGFTERSYMKVCAPTLSELRAWVKRNGRPSGSFSKECSLCQK